MLRKANTFNKPTSLFLNGVTIKDKRDLREAAEIGD
jgi:hypothetical protein